ncbi:hypothetical protein JHK87_004176 [Glycine soja]|nr:hypothetical protein JHK87_004176 [Glycine soja]
MLNLRCLAIVFDLDEKLIVANTMKSFEDRIEDLRGWLLRGSHSSPTSSSPASTTLAFQPHVAHIGDIFKYFTSYKVRVPITGAIILDETYERRVRLYIITGVKDDTTFAPLTKKEINMQYMLALEHSAIWKVRFIQGFLLCHKLRILKYICFGSEGVAKDKLVFGMLKHGHMKMQGMRNYA